MKAAPIALLAALAAAAAGCGGSAARAAQGPLLAGQVQVVAYADGDVRICPPFGIALDLIGPQRPPLCTHGLRAVGVDTNRLSIHPLGRPERWGFLYLTGRYHGGVFWVKSQRPHGPTPQPAGTSAFDKPPCPAPPGGWVLDTRTPAQEKTIDHYSELAGHRDLVDIAFFDQDSVLTVASTNPARTRAVLGPYWYRQLCVVKARYSRATVVGVGRRLQRLMTSPSSADYGWITGAGGVGPIGNNGQPRTSVQVLLETPRLRALLRRLPKDLVVVQATLSPVKSS